MAFDSVWPDWTGLKGRTLWDIAELLLVPLSLALVAYLLSGAQRRRTARSPSVTARPDRELARTREQYDTVQNYLSVITELIRSGQLEDDAPALGRPLADADRARRSRRQRQADGDALLAGGRG